MIISFFPSFVNLIVNEPVFFQLLFISPSYSLKNIDSTCSFVMTAKAETAPSISSVDFACLSQVDSKANVWVGVAAKVITFFIVKI